MCDYSDDAFNHRAPGSAALACVPWLQGTCTSPGNTCHHGIYPRMPRIVKTRIIEYMTTHGLLSTPGQTSAKAKGKGGKSAWGNKGLGKGASSAAPSLPPLSDLSEIEE